MKRLFVFFTLLLILVSALQAQELPPICGPSDIDTRADDAINRYKSERTNTDSMNAALDELQKLQDALDDIQDLCANIASVDDGSTGSGTLQDPYTFGTVGDTGEGFSIQLTGYIRPADRSYITRICSMIVLRMAKYILLSKSP